MRPWGLWTEVAGVGFALFAVYAAGACPTIYVGDSGELVAAVHTLGIPHPTGYPLYVLLGKLWTLVVPADSIAFRMSLFSAACAAGAAAALHGLARSLGLSRVAALIGALLLGSSPSFWAEANVQRVYALNALFMVLALAAALAWQRRGGDRRLGLAFFLAALGAANHAFMAVFALVLAVWAPLVDRTLLRRRGTLAACLGAAAAGLLPYLFLPLRSRQEPRLDWGDPETLANFARVVLRRDFWERAWVASPADLLRVLADYLASFPRELTWAGVGLALLGLLAARRPRPQLSLPISLMAANLLAVAVHGSRTDLFLWHRYYVPSYLVATLLAALGAAAIEERIRRAAERRPWGRASLVAWCLVGIALPAARLVRDAPGFDRSRYRVADDFSRTLLATLPPGAHLAATDDNVLFVLIYLQLVEGVRPDVDLILQGVGEAALPALRFDPEEDPLYFTHHPNWHLSALAVVPVGLAFQVVRAGESPPAAGVPKLELAGEADPGVPKDYLTRNLIGHFHYMLGLTLEAQNDWPAAARELASAATAAPDNDVLFYNLGLVYERCGLIGRAMAAFERSQAINPRPIPSQHPVRAADRLAELGRERDRLREVEERLLAAAGLAGLPSGVERHLRLAELLDRAGEPSAALGHRRLAAELER